MSPRCGRSSTRSTPPSRSRPCAASGTVWTNGDMTPAIALDTRDPRPLYEQIADALATAIESGELAPEQRLPPIRSLAGELDVALVTVSQAYETLASRGRVVSRVGRGTFVAPKDAAADAPFARTWEPSQIGRASCRERV